MVYNQHQGQLNLQSLWGGEIEHRSVWLGLKHGTFTCDGWQTTLCDPMRQVR